MKRKIRMGLIVLAIAMGLGGCANLTLEDIRSYTDNMDNAMQEVIDRNVSIINQLHVAGILDDSQKELWENSIRNKCGALMSTASKGGADSFKQFKSALVDVATTTNDEKTSDGDSRYPKYNKIVESGIKGNGESAKALMLFDDSSVDTFLSDLNRPVYVLNSTRIVNGAADKIDLKYLQLALSVLKGDLDNFEKVMADEGLTDADRLSDIGNLGDLKSNLTNLTPEQQEKLEKFVLTYFKNTNSNLSSLKVTDIFVDSKADPIAKAGGKAYTNKTNTDLCIASDGLTAITMRVHELNKDLISFINGYSTGEGTAENSLSGSYYLCKTSKIALKLDYDMEVISDIYTGSVNTPGSVEDTSWEIKTDHSNFSISIYDGKMHSLDGNENRMNPNLFYSNSVIVHPSNVVKSQIGYVQKYTTEKDGLGSIVNSSDIDFNIPSVREIDGKKVYVAYTKTDGDKAYANYEYADCPTVILRDYLEYTYYPNAVASENFIATGRRLRVNKLSGTLDDIPKFAEALTKDGRRFEVPMYISLKDIIDYSSGVGYYTDVAEKLGLGDSNSQKVTEELAKDVGSRQAKLKSLFGSGVDPADVDTTQEDSTGSSVQLQYNAYFNWIRPVEVFGTKSNDTTGEQAINIDDTQGVKDNLTPTIWGMFTSIPLSSNLYSVWVKASIDNESGSMLWWNEWLRSNKFSYKITEDMLSKKIDSNMVTKGNAGITIDLNKAAEIQSIHNELAEFKEERSVRTFGKLAGQIVIVYSLLLLGAWVVDVNIDNGPKFFRRMMFNKYEAILSSKNSVGSEHGVKYMGYMNLLMTVFIWICVGLILIIVDIVEIKDFILKYSDGLIKAVSKMLFG